MKHIKLYEEFINEAKPTPKAKRVETFPFSLKELVKKSVGKLRNLSTFAEGAGKKAFAGLEMY